MQNLKRAAERVKPEEREDVVLKKETDKSA
jgi:hypothetical protein